MPDNGSLFYSSGGGTLNNVQSFASDAAYVAANGTAANGNAYYNTTAGAIRAYESGAWRFIDRSPQPNLIYNVGLGATVATNALTVAIKTLNLGADPTASDTVAAAFRNATSTTGTASIVESSVATSIVIPSGTTIGTTSGLQQYIFVYALNNAGTIELALSLAGYFEEGSIQSTTAISGGISATTLYSTTARTNVAIRLIGRISISEASAGTWATAPTEVSCAPITNQRQVFIGQVQSTSGTTTSATFASPSNTISVTFIAARTKNYRVYSTPVACDGSAAGNTFSVKITATAGSPTSIADGQSAQDVSTGLASNPISHSPFGVFACVAGTSYTFQLQAKISGGTFTASFSTRTNAYLIAEEM